MSTDAVRQFAYRPPTGATRILLVRHGESEPARRDLPFPLVDGHGDPALHRAGEDQARRVGDRLAGMPLDAIYVTTLRRTHQTAAPLAAKTGLTPLVEADLREVHLGEWEGGLLRIKAAEGDPLHAEVHRRQRWDVIPGSEPLEDFDARTQAGLRRIASAHVGQCVVAVCHGGVINQLLCRATGTSGFAFVHAANGSISELVVEPDRQVLRSFNDTAHLA